MYHGTKCDVMTFAGTIGLFLTLLFLFIRFLPALNMFEMRSITPEADEGARAGGVGAMHETRTTSPSSTASWPSSRTPEELVAAIGEAKAAGFTKLDAFTPYPVEKVIDALDLHDSKLPLITLAARHLRRGRRLRLRLLGDRDRLPAQHRRPPAQLLARVHPGHVRGGGLPRRPRRRASG